MWDGIRQKFYIALGMGETKNRATKFFEPFLLVLISLNVLAVLSDSMIHNAQLQNILRIFEICSVAVFTVEYMLRIWVSDIARPDLPTWKARFLYLFSFMAIIDLLAIVPFYLPFFIPIDLRSLRILRLFRLMRLFKASQFTSALTTVIKVVKSKSQEMASSILVVIVLIVMTAAIMFSIESVAQPEVFSDMGDALWWAVATYTTVGYGDIYPITTMGRILSSVISLLGIGVVAIPTGILAIRMGFNILSSKSWFADPLFILEFPFWSRLPVGLNDLTFLDMMKP